MTIAHFGYFIHIYLSSFHCAWSKLNWGLRDRFHLRFTCFQHRALIITIIIIVSIQCNDHHRQIDRISKPHQNIFFCPPSNICRYNISGFVEELPRLPENRYQHACAALPSTGVSPTHILKPVQAFIVVGGYDGSRFFSSVVTLLPGAPTWTYLASLPRGLIGARASIVGGRLRVNGGYGGTSHKYEVIIK